MEIIIITFNYFSNKFLKVVHYRHAYKTLKETIVTSFVENRVKYNDFIYALKWLGLICIFYIFTLKSIFTDE